MKNKFLLLMKPTYLFFILLSVISFSTSSKTPETKILDSNVSFVTNPGILSVYLSDDGSDLSSVEVKLGTAYGSSNTFDNTYSVGSTISVTDNTLSIPLTSVTTGDYYVAITITRSDASTQIMEYHIQ